MQCLVEILSIGNELLLGNTVNTNASWLATQITSMGGRVTRIITVPDNQNDISEAINQAIKRRPDFLITTGGIGPTFDDMTLKAVAKAFGLSLKRDSTALEMVRKHYVQRFPNRRISLTKPRLKMATIPAGGTPIANPVGTAPGVRLLASKTEIMCLPGVPKEAKAIFRSSVSHSIRAKAGGMKFAEKWFKVQGIMESSLAPVIDQVMARWPGVYIKSHPRGGEERRRPFLELHFSTSSRDTRRAERLIQKATEDMSTQLEKSKAKITPRR